MFGLGKKKNVLEVDIDPHSRLGSYRWNRFKVGLLDKLADCKSLPKDQIVLHIFSGSLDSEELLDGKLHLQLIENNGGENPNFPIMAESSDPNASAVVLHSFNYLGFKVAFEDHNDNWRQVLNLVESVLAESFRFSDQQQFEAAIVEFKKVQLERSKAEWLKITTRHINRTINGAEKDLGRLTAEVERLQQELTKALRRQENQRLKIEQLKSTLPDVEKRSELEFNSITKQPHVRRFTITDNVITVFTDRLYVSYEGKTYDLGDFKIQIYMDGSSGGVRMYNLTRTFRGYHAPHVDGSGSPCLGNISAAVPAYIAAGEYGVVVTLAIQYLQTTNTGNYQNIDNWPLVPKTQPELATAGK